jgi:hypothetical protein
MFAHVSREKLTETPATIFNNQKGTARCKAEICSTPK